MRALSQRGLVLAAAIGMTAVGAPRLALAADDPFAEVFALAWDAPPDCPSRARVEAEVVRLLGGAVAVPRGGAVQARALVAHEQQWSVSITTHNAGQTGRRFIEASSCQDLADATALIVALMIDPDAVAAHARDTEVEPQAPPAPPPVTAAPPASGPPSRPVEVLAAIHGQASWGLLPGADVGVAAGVGLAAQRWRVELRASYGLRRDQVARAPTVPEAYGEFNFLGGALAACVNLGGAEVAFGPCADAEAGVVSAKGRGVSVGFPARATWLALGAGAYASIALGRHVAIPLHVDLLAPLLRPEYVIKEVAGTVFQAPALGVRLLAGMAWHF